MTKLPQITAKQASQMSYSKWEWVLGIGFNGMLIAIAGFVFSIIFMQPIVAILIPDSTRGFMPFSMCCAVIGIILSLTLAVISVLTICLSSFVLVFKLDTRNSRRLTPLIINNCISCLLLTVILVSIFVNYDWYRAVIARNLPILIQSNYQLIMI